MKALTRSPVPRNTAVGQEQPRAQVDTRVRPATTRPDGDKAPRAQAQCCAKISRSVAGCHD